MKKLLLVAIVMGLALAAMIQPSGATGAAGVITTACTTSLYDFPNGAFTKNPDDCDGTPSQASAVGIDYAVGALATADGKLFTGGGPAATRTSFSYNENCDGVPPGAFPVNGQAKGNFTIGGTYNGQPATLLAGFTWQRIGLTAIITFDKTIAGHDLESGKVVAAGLYGLDTNNDFTTVEVSIAGATAISVGQLIPQEQTADAGAGACPDNAANAKETVTALALGGFLTLA